MKILVTGNEGYIGTILTDVLVKAGQEVTGLDTGFYNAGWLYDGVKKPHLQHHKDIRQVTVEDLKGLAAVVHLAELSNDPLGQNNPQLTVEVNHKGTVHLVKLCKKAGIKRFVYYSSCSVYGASDEFVDEYSPTQPLTAYAKCKVKNEAYLMSAGDDTFSPIIFRNATVYGASPRMRFDLVVNSLAARAYTTKKISMDSDGTPWRPLVHVQDVAEATLVALTSPKVRTHKQIVNIGSNAGNYQIKTVAQLITRVFPGCVVTLNPKGADKRNYRVRFDKINTVLPGFTCNYDIEKGARELKSIFDHVRLTYEESEGSKYIRLKAIAALKTAGKLDEKLFWRSS